MKFFNKKPKIQKNNDSFFINIVAIFTTLAILLQFVNLYYFTLIVFSIGFIISHLAIEIFDKHRAFRLVKSATLALLILYGTFIIINYVSMKFLQSKYGISYINLNLYHILEILIIFVIVHDVNIVVYAKLKYKFYNKLIILRHIIAIAFSNIVALILFLLFNFKSFSFILLGKDLLIKSIINIIDIPFFIILLILFKDYGFKNNNNNHYYNKKRFNKNEKYNANNAKSTTSAKRYGKSSK